MMKKQKSKIVIGYTRVSTQEQVRNGLSLDAQAEQIRKYAELKGLGHIEIISDQGISAKNLRRRPGIQRIIKMVQRNEISAVITCKLDRMFRSTKDAIMIIELFKDKGVQFHCLHENIQTDTAIGTLFFQIISAFAEFERNICSERIKSVFDHKKAQGKKTSGRWAPLGYDVDLEGFLKVNTVERSCLSRMEELRSEGSSLKMIASSLNHEGFSTKLGRPWNAVQVHRYLRC